MKLGIDREWGAETHTNRNSCEPTISYRITRREGRKDGLNKINYTMKKENLDSLSNLNFE